MTDIDWTRMAVPQADGYDTAAVLRLATTGPSLLRPEPYSRRPTDGAPTIFDGRVAVRNRSSGGLQPPRYAPADPAHPHLAQAASLLTTWPEMAAQFPELVDTIQPWTDTSAKPDQWLATPGSSSHSEEPEFGVIMVTVDSPIALAQAMVHEMAHHKLRAMGVSLLQASRIVMNDPSELYRSPIITNRLRPMTAVLHAQYAFMHVTALDITIHEHRTTDDHTRDLAAYLLARNVPRMEAGYDEITANIRTDGDGNDFMASFMDWSRAVLSEGREILDGCGLGMPTL
jgi:HEXXH motif-containing protein